MLIKSVSHNLLSPLVVCLFPNFVFFYSFILFPISQPRQPSPVYSICILYSYYVLPWHKYKFLYFLVWQKAFAFFRLDSFHWQSAFLSAASSSPLLLLLLFLFLLLLIFIFMFCSVGFGRLQSEIY